MNAPSHAFVTQGIDSDHSIIISKLYLKMASKIGFIYSQRKNVPLVKNSYKYSMYIALKLGETGWKCIQKTCKSKIIPTQLWRRIQAIGLVQKYKNKESNIEKWLKQLFVKTNITNDATFPPSIWVKNEATLERTTNNCESFHAKFCNDYVSSTHHFMRYKMGDGYESLSF
ncbi:Uncharacterized protein FWK35_00018796 [Aphis craccivora]|uniref:Uncharacterized protein n=1 Tax=Aphis craccivora TaxID=307492 RepID=A0A6G0YHX5_APHCR|nr:Uncharacterized protein FWK35_00018796 [Aphis craccivora]